MTVKFISQSAGSTPENENTHLHQLEEVLKDAKEILIAVAFLRESGAKLLKTVLSDLSSKGVKINVYAGLDFFQTEPKAIRLLIDSFSGKSEAQISLLPSSKSKCTFHPKVYAIFTDSQLHLITGSANMTAGGLISNDEASTLISGPKESKLSDKVRSFFSKVHDRALSGISMEQLLEEYGKQRKKTQEKRKALNLEIENATRNLPKLVNSDFRGLSDWVDVYRNHIIGQGDFRNRTENYSQAKDLLLDLINNPAQSPAAFEERLKLLGQNTTGREKLWYSGDWHRNRGRMSERYEEMAAMFREMEQLENQDPETAFNIVQRHKASIPYLGVVVPTETLNTFHPTKFPVATEKATAALQFFGIHTRRDPLKFTPTQYAQYTRNLLQIQHHFEFEHLGHVDHFLAFVQDLRSRTEADDRLQLGDRNALIKIVGGKGHRISDSEDFSALLHRVDFPETNKQPPISTGDVLIVFGAGSSNVLYVGEVLTNPRRDNQLPKHQYRVDDFPWSVMVLNLTPNFAKNWARLSVNIYQLAKDFSSVQEKTVTKRGGSTLGGFKWGHSSLAVESEFAEFVLNQIASHE